MAFPASSEYEIELQVNILIGTLIYGEILAAWRRDKPSEEEG